MPFNISPAHFFNSSSELMGSIGVGIEYVNDPLWRFVWKKKIDDNEVWADANNACVLYNNRLPSLQNYLARGTPKWYDGHLIYWLCWQQQSMSHRKRLLSHSTIDYPWLFRSMVDNIFPFWRTNPNVVSSVTVIANEFKLKFRLHSNAFGSRSF